MTTYGQGGMVTTSDARLADRLRRLRTYGLSQEWGTSQHFFKPRLPSASSSSPATRRSPAPGPARRTPPDTHRRRPGLTRVWIVAVQQARGGMQSRLLSCSVEAGRALLPAMAVA
ncbi:DegT/DnrJ/EryC1/StrS family aminotransferase [Streptomyces sp. HMX112]|uniref:DegT/DnrJ/EryC1/StrS family aminotransferase n=1 Tax=Streptomyces sp. HMX112 TaxID=3390850 RepID=UPI003A7F67D9